MFSPGRASIDMDLGVGSARSAELLHRMWHK